MNIVLTNHDGFVTTIANASVKNYEDYVTIDRFELGASAPYEPVIPA